MPEPKRTGQHQEPVQGKLGTNAAPRAALVPLLSMIYETKEPLGPTKEGIWVGAVPFLFLF